MMRRSIARVKTVGDALRELVEKFGIKEKLQEYEAVLRWEEIVGPQIARAASAGRINKGILFVRVKSSAWRNELTMRKEEIIKKINASLGEQVVRDIKFH